VKFTESYETPNIELRPQGWFHNDGVPFSMNYAQINHVLSKIDPAKNVELKIDVPNMEEDPSLLPTKIPTTKTPEVYERPSNNVFRRRPISRRPTQPSAPESRHWLHRDQPGLNDRVPNQPNQKTDKSLKPEYIIGIAVGVFIILSLLIVGLVKCYLVRRAKSKEKKRQKEELKRKRNYDEGLQLAPPTNKKQKYLPYDHKNKCYKDKRNTDLVYHNTRPGRNSRPLPKQQRNTQNYRTRMPHDVPPRYRR